MPFKGIVHVDDKMEVRLQTNPNNSGSTALFTGHVPDGVHPPPPTEFDMVAAGGTMIQHTRVRPGLSIKITVDVPDKGAAQLAVFVNGVQRDHGTVGDVIWTYGIA